MKQSHALSIAAAAAAALLLAAPSLVAQQPGEQIEGVITSVELTGSPRTITVRRPGGGEVTAGIANRTRVVYDRQFAGFFPEPHVSQLKPGMSVRFKFDPDTVARIHVLDVPQNLLPRPEAAATPTPTPTPARGGATRQLKVRLLTIDRTRGEFRADVAGRRESYQAESPRLLRRFAEGDLVTITVEGSGGSERVTAIEEATVSGRVVRVDQRRGELVIEVGGSTGTYGVADKKLLEDVRVGDRIRFEYEDRPGGRKVVTAIR